MPQRINIILVVLLMLSTESFSQQKTLLSGSNTIIKTVGNLYPINFNEVTYYRNYFKNISVKMPSTVSINSISTKNLVLKAEGIDKGFYCSNLAFFCKKEIQLEKITSVSLRFRLGSLDYVNWLEGKK